MRLFPDNRVVPALMFHSIGLQDHKWIWSHISEPLETFERKIALLNKSGFRTVFWRELYLYMRGDKSLPRKAIFLTFDDGYLDNWVYVLPILSKYGMKATVFVSPEFVEPGNSVRPNLDDVHAGNCDAENLQLAGFLNWAELREMEKSGLVDVQSHAMSHTWYFSGPRLVDLHRPRPISPYPWLFWNERPDRKPFYLSEIQEEFLPWGYPILEHAKSLEVRRFIPDQRSVNDFIATIHERIGVESLRRDDWADMVQTRAGIVLKDAELAGRFETDDERTKRLSYEITGSKEILDKKLNKNVEFICWPGGANSDRVQQIALDAGFKAWTLNSAQESAKRNIPGVDSRSIRRISTGNAIGIRSRIVGFGGARFQLLRILEHQHSEIHSLLLKFYKIMAAIVIWLRTDR